jgi:hypothetical protein
MPYARIHFAKFWLNTIISLLYSIANLDSLIIDFMFFIELYMFILLKAKNRQLFTAIVHCYVHVYTRLGDFPCHFFLPSFLCFLPYFKEELGLAQAKAGCGRHTEPGLL